MGHVHASTQLASPLPFEFGPPAFPAARRASASGSASSRKASLAVWLSFWENRLANLARIEQHRGDVDRFAGFGKCSLDVSSIRCRHRPNSDRNRPNLGRLGPNLAEVWPNLMLVDQHRPILADVWPNHGQTLVDPLPAFGQTSAQPGQLLTGIGQFCLLFGQMMAKHLSTLCERLD